MSVVNTPAKEDLVERVFMVEVADMLVIADITDIPDSPRQKGKLRCAAILGCFP
ncbi:hypothetical protein [Actinomadura harenae]|uniref:hypothetical protein n=1 Tax=Actinomadura harenae TaxID=2483351 RepID=UPI00131511FA|nr:hypothetical protein [Actinomadura harenae]